MDREFFPRNVVYSVRLKPASQQVFGENVFLLMNALCGKHSQAGVAHLLIDNAGFTRRTQ